MQGTVQAAPEPLSAVTAGSKASCAAAHPDFPGSTPRTPALRRAVTAARAPLCPAPGTRRAATAAGARPTETPSRKSQDSGRPDTQSIAAALAGGVSSAPRCAARPVTPAGSLSTLLLLLLSHACLSQLPLFGARGDHPRSPRAAMPGAPTQLGGSPGGAGRWLRAAAVAAPLPFTWPREAAPRAGPADGDPAADTPGRWRRQSPAPSSC